MDSHSGSLTTRKPRDHEFGVFFFFPPLAAAAAADDDDEVDCGESEQ